MDPLQELLARLGALGAAARCTHSGLTTCSSPGTHAVFSLKSEAPVTDRLCASHARTWLASKARPWRYDVRELVDAKAVASVLDPGLLREVRRSYPAAAPDAGS